MQFEYIGIKICSYRLSRGSRLLESLRMRHARLWMYLFMTLALGACAGIPGTKAPGGASLVPEYPTLVIIGDSIMFGSFDGPGTTTAAVFSHDYNWHVINISQSGQMVTAAVHLEIWKAVEFVAGRTTASSDSAKPDTSVVVQLGHNDWLWLGLETEEFEKSYRKLLVELAPLNATTYCVVPIPARWDYNSRVNSSNLTYEDIRVVIRSLANEGLCRLIETRSWYTKEDVVEGYVMPGGLHLNAQGHRIFAEQLKKALSAEKPIPR
jgi:lysophospholipase L1-like esterase